MPILWFQTVSLCFVPLHHYTDRTTDNAGAGKTMKRPTILNATFVRQVRQPGRYGDGRGGYGLTLLVRSMKNGRLSKTWAQRVRINGKETNLGLGNYPVVTLAEARKRALTNRKAIEDGRHPHASKTPTFHQATEKVIAIHRAKWTPRSKTENQWRSLFSAHVLPRIGHKRVDQINSSDVLAILSPLWHSKIETARKTKRYLAAVMRWAVAQGYREDNPADGRIRDALGKHIPQTQHMRALPHGEVGAALAAVESSGAYRSTILATWFLTLTATRSGETRLATWDEVDLNRRVWTVPGSRTKTGRPHRVPLSGAALAILAEAAGFTRGVGLIFPSVTGRAMSDSTISKLFRENAISCVPHGMRSSFRDWCGETGVPREVAEQALSHVVRGVEGAYARSDLLEVRRPVMERWGEYVT